MTAQHSPSPGSIAPVRMELNDAQSVQPCRRFLIQWDLVNGRRACFLAEEFIAELLEQFVCLHVHAAKLNFLLPNSPNRCTSSLAS